MAVRMSRAARLSEPVVAVADATVADVDAAEHDAAQAAAEVELLREQIRNGNALITADQLAKAAGNAEVARLRVEAAHRQRLLDIEQARVAEIERLRVEIPTNLDGAGAAIGDAVAKATIALRNALDLLDAKNATVNGYRLRLNDLAPLPEGLDTSTQRNSSLQNVDVDGERYEVTPPHEVLAQVVGLAMGPGRSIPTQFRDWWFRDLHTWAKQEDVLAMAKQVDA